MAIRLLDTEHLTALGFGAGDALVTAKVTGTGPGGIPWPVYYEAAGVAVMFFGDKVGLPAGVRDSAGISALALLGARVTRAAVKGQLMSGPRAWGGDQGDVGGDFLSGGNGYGDNSGGGRALPPAAKVRLMQGQRVGGGFSISGLPVAFSEPAGVAG
jgi:hypothetical protein